MNSTATAEIADVTDQFSAWRHALETGKPVAYERGSPTAGYYKIRARNKDRSIRWDALAIWEDDGNWYCMRSGPFPAPRHADEIEELFVNANSTPISYELFESVSAGGAWPEDVAPAETPADLTPHEAAAAELKIQQEAAKAWLLGLKDAEGKNRKPATQEEADRAANYGSEFAKLEKKADKAREAEKSPHWEACKAVEAKWKPTIEGADTAKKWAKGLSDDFAKAETARRKREADEANAEAARQFAVAQANEAERLANEARLKAKGVQVPEMARPPVEAPKPVVAEPVKIGTAGRRQSLRQFPTYQIENATALLEFLATRNFKSAALLAASLADAKALHESGTVVPGLKVGTEERMV